MVDPIRIDKNIKVGKVVETMQQRLDDDDVDTVLIQNAYDEFYETVSLYFEVSPNYFYYKTKADLSVDYSLSANYIIYDKLVITDDDGTELEKTDGADPAKSNYYYITADGLLKSDLTTVVIEARLDRLRLPDTIDSQAPLYCPYLLTSAAKEFVSHYYFRKEGINPKLALQHAANSNKALNQFIYRVSEQTLQT